ncbi:LacI family DNA-binding transcriptional regulator [Cellulomonas endophytica]|uniref:LacI family DNA-binding transcriptional regulator n=1 Tax=Cellulomonas endophytica TaxID=2494735 RepID=UPI0013E914AE|nr:LacI family DNA-binding transcriptional regulator [Cellulomonas endophytica]
MSLTGNGPTLRDVAVMAAVSIKTASRVLNDDPAVAAPTRAAVMEAMRALDYQPDPAARSLRAGKDRLVGVVIDSIGDVFFAQLVAQIEATLDTAGYRVLVASSNRDPVRERDLVQSFVSRRCAGVIVAPNGPDTLADLRMRDVPVVFVDRAGTLAGSQSVVSDDVGFGRTATSHLIAHGHTRIALLSDTPVIDTTRQRHEGFRAAMAEAGLPVDERLVRTDCPGPAEVMRVVPALLGMDEPPTALISTNTRLSLGVVPALHQRGRTDVALVAIGDFAMAESRSPAVTVIDHSPERVGDAAAAAMLARLAPPGDQPSQDPTVIVPARLIARGSGELLP